MAATGRVRVEAPTEKRNSATVHIDTLDSIGILKLINAEDALVPHAVGAALPELARAVDLAVASLCAGGRVHYFGAGSSGRYGVLDAAEIPPTYGYPPDRFVAHIAGGARRSAGPSRRWRTTSPPADARLPTSRRATW